MNDQIKTEQQNEAHISPSELNERLCINSRYPYTFACDYLREQIGDDYGRGLISRGAASHVRGLIAKATGINDREIACKLADEYLKTHVA